MSWLEALLVAAAGLVGGFVSTLASKGSAVTLLALEFLSLPEHVANGTNRLSVIALGLVGAASFYRRGLLDWRKGFWISALVGSLAAVEFGETTLDAIVTVGLAVVLGLLLVKPGRWLRGREGPLRPFGPRQAAVYFAIGVYAGLVVLGSGFFMLAALVLLTGCDLPHGNALKSPLSCSSSACKASLSSARPTKLTGSPGYRSPWAAPPGRTSPRCSPRRNGPGSGSIASSCSW